MRVGDCVGQGEDVARRFSYNGSMSTQVLLVSRGMFHDGLLRVLKDYERDVEVVGSAASWPEARAMMEDIRPDVLIADYQFAEEMMADLEQMAADEYSPGRILFVILDENKAVIYQRQQLTNMTIDRLIEVL